MKKPSIEELYDRVEEKLYVLTDLSVSKGFHLDNNLEKALFMLLVDRNVSEISMLEKRVDIAIKKLQDGTFRLSDVNSPLHQDTNVA